MALYKNCGCKIIGLARRGHRSKFFRGFATETQSIRKWKNNLHVYSYSFNWGSLNELSHVLARDVIYNQDGLVVINKPFGIGKDAPVIKDSKINIEKRLRTALVGERDFYLNDIQPLIARKLGYESLEIVKIPERYTSGITILSSSKEMTGHVKNCVNKGKASGMLMDTYHLVCLGSSSPLSFQGRVAINYEEDISGKGVQPVLVRTWSKNAAKRGDVVQVSVEHTTLERGKYASLVEIKPSRTKAHFLRFYMAYMLSPVLGDNLYGSRVQKIGPTPVAINPFSERAKIPKRLEDPILSALDLERKDELFIPCHIHLHKVTIPHFKGKEQSLDLVAPYPEVFEWSRKRLIESGTTEEERTKME